MLISSVAGRRSSAALRVGNARAMGKAVPMLGTSQVNGHIHVPMHGTSQGHKKVTGEYVKASQVNGYINGHFHPDGQSKSARMVTVRRFGPVALVSLDGKIRANAMTPEMGAELRHEVELMCDPNSPTGKDLGCVVITGVNNAFLSGGHYEQFFEGRKEAAGPRTRESRETNEDFMYKFFTDFLSFRQLPVPVIAAINGHAVGAGLGPAMGADIRVCCAEHGRMSANFVKLGVMPGTGMTWMFPNVVGEAVATQMLLTGEMIDAKRAREIGLVSESVDIDYRPENIDQINGLAVPTVAEMEAEMEADNLYNLSGNVPGVVFRALELAFKISSNAPLAVRGTVRAMRSRQEGRFVKNACGAPTTLFERQLRMEAREQGLSWESPDFEIGLDAMAKKGKPEFPTSLYTMPAVEHELIEENFGNIYSQKVKNDKSEEIPWAFRGKCAGSAAMHAMC